MTIKRRFTGHWSASIKAFSISRATYSLFAITPFGLQGADGAANNLTRQKKQRNIIGFAGGSVTLTTGYNPNGR